MQLLLPLTLIRRCVYEWAACLAAHGPDGLHLRAGPADRAALAANLDVEAAQCYNPRDKDMILQDVVRGRAPPWQGMQEGRAGTYRKGGISQRL